MGLVNLNYKSVRDKDEDDTVEIFFNEACKLENGYKSLDEQGPLSVAQLARITNSYFSFSNIWLNKFNVFYTNDGMNAISINNLLQWNNETSYAAIIASFTFGGHATLIIKNKEKFIHIHTSPDYNTIRQCSDTGENIKITSPLKENKYSLIKFNGVCETKTYECLLKAGDTLFIFN